MPRCAFVQRGISVLTYCSLKCLVRCYDEDGEKVERAHTGSTGGLPHVGKAWYRLKFELPDEIAAKRVLIGLMA